MRREAKLQLSLGAADARKRPDEEVGKAACRQGVLRLPRPMERIERKRLSEQQSDGRLDLASVLEG